MTRRILTIDGGGLRGVFAAAVIEQMEKVTGKPAHEIFDCFCGTSAGSLLAAGLAAGKSAGEMKNLFISLGEQMSGLMGAGNGQRPNPREARAAASKALEDLLRSDLLFGPTLLPSQLQRWLAIPARNMALGQVVFFGNFPKDQVNAVSFWDDSPVDENEPIWKVVRRSTALPPLFAPDGPYLDGGVSPFANPTYAAYIGVQHRLGWNPHRERLRFYSVGTGYHRKRVPDVDNLEDVELYDAMADAMMQDINFLQHQVMKRSSGEGTIWYHRYNISFDEKGFQRYGLPVPDDETLAALASTASPLLRELAEIGTVVGQQTVEAADFQALKPLPERRTTGERRVVRDRREGESAAQALKFAERRAKTPRRKETQKRRVLSDVITYGSRPAKAVPLS